MKHARMRNCLHKMIEEVFAGQVYFFSWNGAERATVLVIYSGSELANWKLEARPAGARRVSAMLRKCPIS